MNAITGRRNSLRLLKTKKESNWLMNKINLTFDFFTIQRFAVSSVIRKCVDATLKAEGITVPCEINILVTNDAGIHAINLASRQIDSPTDVLSFPMFSFEPGNPPSDWDNYIDPETGLCPLGDMAISYERAVAQSKEFGHSVRREIGYLTIHSMLHLLGYDHLDEGPQKKQMRQREEEIAAKLARMQRD